MPKKENGNEEETVVNEDSVELNSFQAYESSEDDETRIVNGKPVVADFHLYDSKNKKRKRK